MEGLVRFLKDQPFGAGTSIMLLNQGALDTMNHVRNKKIGIMSPYLINDSFEMDL